MLEHNLAALKARRPEGFCRWIRLSTRFPAAVLFFPVVAVVFFLTLVGSCFNLALDIFNALVGGVLPLPVSAVELTLWPLPVSVMELPPSVFLVMCEEWLRRDVGEVEVVSLPP